MLCNFLMFTALLMQSSITLGQKYADVQPRESIVREGEPFQFVCRTGQAIDSCRVELPSGQGISLKPGVQAQNLGLEYFGDGFQAGQCGLKVQRTDSDSDGVYTCSMTKADSLLEFYYGGTKLTLARPPMAPKLRLFDRNDEYKEGDTLNAECIVRNGRPAANISWFIGDEPIQSGLQAKSIGSEDPNKPDVQSVAQNLSRPVSWRDHGKKLRCVAQHIGIHNDDADNYRDESLIQVRFAPRPSKQTPIKLCGFEEGKEGFVNYVVIANPRPEFQWRVDNEDMIEGETRKGYEAMIVVPMEMGRYEAKLRILNVSMSDLNKDFHLTARNELGTQIYSIYTIRISTHSEEEKSNFLVHTIILGTVLCLVFIVIVAYKIIKNLKRNGSTPQPAVDEEEVVYDEIDLSKAVPVPKVLARVHAEYLGVLEPYHYDEVREPQPWFKRLRYNRPRRSPRVQNNVDNNGYEIPIVRRNIVGSST